jgi:hypothetical protein
MESEYWYVAIIIQNTATFDTPERRGGSTIGETESRIAAIKFYPS